MTSTKLIKHEIEYLDNGTTKFVQIPALSEGMAEDVFCETYGENPEIIKITALA